jgi:bacterioferritin (cytochrome b1)
MTLTDVKTLRARARQHLEDGVVTAGHSADRALVQMIREDLVAERIAIDSYLDALRYLGDQNPTTSEMLKAILGVEERHADELADLLTDLPGRAS